MKVFEIIKLVLPSLITVLGSFLVLFFTLKNDRKERKIQSENQNKVFDTYITEQKKIIDNKYRKSIEPCIVIFDDAKTICAKAECLLYICSKEQEGLDWLLTSEKKKIPVTFHNVGFGAALDLEFNNHSNKNTNYTVYGPGSHHFCELNGNKMYYSENINIPKGQSITIEFDINYEKELISRNYSSLVSLDMIACDIEGNQFVFEITLDLNNNYCFEKSKYIEFE